MDNLFLLWGICFSNSIFRSGSIASTSTGSSLTPYKGMSGGLGEGGGRIGSLCTSNLYLDYVGWGLPSTDGIVVARGSGIHSTTDVGAGP